MTDPIADMLTRIRNSINANKNEVRLPHSNLKETVARELVKNRFLSKVDIEKASPRSTLIITIAEEGKAPAITEIARMSTPGRRVYSKASEIPRIKNGRGLVLVSTSQGVMNGFEAAKKRLGGEVICKVY